MAIPKAGEWNRYDWTREQLQSYLNAFTGQGDITVTNSGHGGATHMASKHVMLPVGDPDAADTAAHEGTHINQTDNDAWGLLPNRRDPAQTLVLNALEDARMERVESNKRPGLWVQWQMSLDRYMPVIIEEDWLLQAIKGIMFECAGYTYPRDKFRPKARKVLTKFDTTGIKYKVRRAPDTAALVPLVSEVLALFDEPPPPRKRQQLPKVQAEPEPDEGPSPFGMPAPVGAPTEGDAESGQECDGSLTCAHCNALEEADSGTQVVATRKAIEYDADDARAADELARKAGAENGVGDPGLPTEKLEDGEYDKVTGGPSVNRLLERAKNLNKRISDFERKAKEATQDERSDDVYRPLVGTVPASKETGQGALADDAPEHAKPYANTDALVNGELTKPSADRYGRQTYDWDKLLPALHYGGTGYTGVPARVHDARDFSNPHVWAGNQHHWLAKVLNYEAKYAPVGNYLGKQMRIWLQSQDRSAMRDHERTGIFDPRRGYQMSIGNFDVYRNPPKNHPSKPMVTLSVDMSSSMMGYGSSPEGIPNWQSNSSSFHAVMATWLMARALEQIRCPFEVIGFGGASDLYLMKPFEMPYNDKAKGAIANVAMLANGGTPAAEGLALSWVRALTRPERRKIVIQVTDGYVAENTKRVAQNIRDQGGITIGIGIGLDDERFRDYYGDGFAVASANELPPRFVALLRRLALQGKLR